MNKFKRNVSVVITILVVSVLALEAAAAATKLRAKDIEAKWSSNGRLRTPFHNCVQINEPGDPESKLWDDNYLCFNSPDHGFSYSYTGPISGKYCVNLDIKGGVWADNYLCSDNVQFAWFGRQIERGYICIRILEPADPDPRANGRSANAFCIKK